MKCKIKFLSLFHLQAQYGQEMVRRHGEEYDWRKEPIDPMAVYASGGGKSHGR